MPKKWDSFRMKSGFKVFKNFSMFVWRSMCNICRVDTLNSMKARVKSLRDELVQPATFKEVYKFAFQFYREADAKVIGTSKSLP